MTKEIEVVKIVTGVTDYEVLTNLEGFNREIETSSLNKLIESMRIYGFVGCIIAIETSAFGKKEMLVNGEGQHRVAAAKFLGIPYNYQIIRLVEDTQMAVCQFISMLNSSATKWSPMKYIDSFAKAGAKEYIIMKKALKETKLTITDLQNIYLFGCGASEVKAFKSGEMKFPDIKKSEKLKDAIMAVKDILPNKSYVRRSLFKAFKLIDVKDYGRFVNAIEDGVKYVKKNRRELPENEKMLFTWLKEIFELEFA